MGNRSRKLNSQMSCHAPKIVQLLTACKVYCEGLTPVPRTVTAIVVMLFCTTGGVKAGQAAQPGPPAAETARAGGEAAAAATEAMSPTGRVEVLLFSTHSCPPCQVVKRIIGDIEAAFERYVDVRRIDCGARHNVRLLHEYGVFGTPTVVMRYGDKEVGRLIGVSPKSSYLEILADTLGLEIEISPEDKHMPDIR
jgi:thiol-disulfide isomerase/thioredoxin